MKDPRSLIKSHLVSEKGTRLTQKHNKYTFKVDPKANKIEIRRAIEEIFKVKGVGVNTSNVSGKWKRVRIIPGKTSAWKKAVVTLKAGDKIEMV